PDRQGLRAHRRAAPRPRRAHRARRRLALVRSATMQASPAAARVALAREGSANVSTGLPVLDHLVAELAATGRFKLALEVAPGGADEAVGMAGTALGTALAELFDAGASGRGSALVPADEALALAALERATEARLVTNVDFS